MNDKNKPGMGFEVNIRSASSNRSVANTDADTPFYIAVLGDFSGRFNQPHSEEKPLAQRKLIAIDRDNFDQVLAGFKLSFNISPTEQSGNYISIDIVDLDDFHPDALYEKLGVFSKLRSIRRRLKDKSSFDAAASEIMGWLVADEQPDKNPSATREVERVNDLPPDNLLDNVLESTQLSTSDLESLTRPGGIDQLVKQIIAPYVEPSTNPRQQEMLDAVDEATAEHMRQILHHPYFQNVEAAWRSVYFLISRVETGRNLKIYLLDVSKRELEVDLASEVDSSALHKLFCEPVINDIPWSLLVGNYTFEDKIDDILLLAQIGSIAKSAQAPFIASAKETLAGCVSFGQYADADDWQYELKPGVENAWQMLRQNPVADYIGLALPRILLRLPYGKKSRPIEAFTFEEMTGKGAECHECLLWGNAAFIKAEQFARAFAEKNWNMYPGDASQTDNLPLYYYEDDGETLLMPCAEIYLTEKGGRKLSEQGLIALWSVKNMDSVRSSDFNALSADGKNLQGKWVK